MNELAFNIVQQATGSEDEQPEETSHKDPSLAERGRRGGKSRAKKLTAEQRSESARKAAEARWNREQETG